MVYKWYILPIGGLYATYHLLGEPETTIEKGLGVWTPGMIFKDLYKGSAPRKVGLYEPIVISRVMWPL